MLMFACWYTNTTGFLSDIPCLVLFCRVLTSMGWHGESNDDDELSKPITEIEIEEFLKKKEVCNFSQEFLKCSSLFLLCSHNH